MARRAARGVGVDVVKLQSIIDAIEDNGPRNHYGELELPYRKWVVDLKKDLAKYVNWRKAVEGQQEVDKK